MILTAPPRHLALRLRDFKTGMLRFLHDPGLPFTNNFEERDPCMIKLRMKTSGTFRSPQEAKDFATLCSALSTARKQGRNRIETLMQGPTVLLDSLCAATPGLGLDAPRQCSLQPGRSLGLLGHLLKRRSCRSAVSRRSTGGALS